MSSIQARPPPSTWAPTGGRRSWRGRLAAIARGQEGSGAVGKATRKEMKQMNTLRETLGFDDTELARALKELKMDDQAWKQQL